MSSPDCSTHQRSIKGLLTGSFKDAFFVPHKDVAATEESATPTPTSSDTATIPEWYYCPGSLDHLNPAHVRAGASHPALQTSGIKSSRGRDSVDDGDDKGTPPHKKRRLSPIKFLKVSLRRLFPSRGHQPPPYSLPLSCGLTHSETALDHYPLEIEVDNATPLQVYWEMMGCNAVLEPARPARPRNVSSPPVLADSSSASVRWWSPSGRQYRPSNSSHYYGSGPGSAQITMSEPVSPVTQVPASPRLEGESKEDDQLLQMEALEI